MGAGRGISGQPPPSQSARACNLTRWSGFCIPRAVSCYFLAAPFLPSFLRRCAALRGLFSLDPVRLTAAPYIVCAVSKRLDDGATVHLTSIHGLLSFLVLRGFLSPTHLIVVKKPRTCYFVFVERR
ncbi:hypothetical protein BDN71DRAFT_301026 [Pleurotus eryngii]|uniref:Uncharacterized protein n=1 Tax=Pleurotus eryngii TaxID=5323 RepID=A0A9P5ZLI2_PLEER|nr:hypothetical protein BDN71DRAFT_301026 [Pleurotus eryngii]